MLFNGPKDTKELIIATLSEAPISSVELQRLISEKRQITKQAFYKALRELIQKKIVIKNKQLLLLSQVWIYELKQLLSFIEDKNFHTKQTFVDIQEGEYLTYHFKTTESLDEFWLHYFLLAIKHKNDLPIIFYGLHEYFVLSDQKGTNMIYHLIKEKRYPAYLVIGSNTQLDRSTTQSIKNFDITTAYEEKPSFNKNYFITVVGDYILNTVLDMNTANAIDALYRNNKAWSEEVSEQLTAILKNLKRSKVVIERNKKKADMIRKKLMKYFVFV